MLCLLKLSLSILHTDWIGDRMYSVYLVEDELWQLESLYKSIEWNKHNATVVGRSTSSLEAYKEIGYTKPDIVFTDIRMPDMNGLELMEGLGAEKISSVFVVLTGHAEFEYAQKALACGAVAYCLKPFDEDEIVEALIRAQKVFEEKKVLKELNGDNSSGENIGNETYRRIIDYVHEHFKDEISLNQLAEMFHTNASYLSKLFKKEAGVNYSTYINQLRLDYACKLMRQTKLTVNEISEMCGFNNYVYFARLFKTKIGMTPTEYREGLF